MRYIGKIEYDYELGKDRYYIYGIGHFGSYIYEYLKNHDFLDRLEGFVDSYRSGIEYNGYEVKCLDEGLEFEPQASFIVGGKYKKEILDILYGMNINNIHIILE